mmetsp:Transcript_27690/g.89076  ORF Transcript_27690/g.89076 Transcript_27690/m.89076 type:complete len:85 (+) Transcript_27690:53-307(+)
MPAETLGVGYFLELLVSSHDFSGGVAMCRQRRWEWTTSLNFLPATKVSPAELVGVGYFIYVSPAFMMSRVRKCAGRGFGSGLLD